MAAQNLRTPGPTPLPPAVREALAREMIAHRGTDFAAVMRDCVEGLQWAFQTQHDVVILTTSGTGGLESVAVNMLSPGQRPVEGRRLGFVLLDGTWSQCAHLSRRLPVVSQLPCVALPAGPHPNISPGTGGSLTNSLTTCSSSIRRTTWSLSLTAARSNRTSGGVLNVLGRALLFPHHVNYHLEHHLYPAVPHYHLPRLHRLLVDKGALDGAEVRDLGETFGLIFAPRAARMPRHEPA